MYLLNSLVRQKKGFSGLACCSCSVTDDQTCNQAKLSFLLSSAWKWRNFWDERL